MSASRTDTGGLLRRVGAFTAACVLISNMIGTGIFGTTGFMARDLGSPGLILGLWALGGVYALLGAVSYGELGAALPRAGGEYVYLGRAFGPSVGFLSGWTSLTIGFSAAIASNAHLFAEHVRELLPALRPDGGGGAADLLARGRALELGMVWALTLVHVAGLGAGSFVQQALTVLKVGALVALVAGGVALGSGDWAHLSTSAPDARPGLEIALVSFLFVSFSYSGWNAVGYIAGELRDPGRTLPRASIVGTLVVVALYLSINAVYLYALPVEELAAEPIALVGAKSAGALFGAGVQRWFTLLLAISIVGAASAMVWAGPRVYYAMAQDGVFPRYFAGTGERSHVPVRSIVLQSAWISVLVLWGEFETLVAFASFVLIVFAALAVLAVPVLRRREPGLVRPFRATWYPWTQVAYLALSVGVAWASVRIRTQESLLGVATVLAGLPFYLYWRRSQRR